jgi:hypothetical protein
MTLNALLSNIMKHLFKNKVTKTMMLLGLKTYYHVIVSTVIINSAFLGKLEAMGSNNPTSPFYS